MTALYLLAQEHRALADKLHDLDLDEQAVIDTLEGESLALEQKAVAVAMVARNFEAHADAIKSAMDTMAARKKAAEKRADSLRKYLMDSMLVAGIKVAESPQLCVAIKGKAPSTEVFDEASIPAEFFDEVPQPPPKLSRTRIAAAIKAGRDVPGARLGADVWRLEIK